MTKPKAIYQELGNSRVHVAAPDGKPECFSRNYWRCGRSPAKWQETKQEITCHHCRVYLAKLEKAANKKVTLRERLFN